ncbi:olfactory receptor 5AR1-like isoform X1 [Pleurodeles waltl]|uniref:olfactory receptor 5AR1-like isoform X1 n=1 Tax=Pleurodeles waltl TaxID=8319 RepID=UPI003709787B
MTLVSNYTMVTEFILLGLTSDSELQIMLFVIFTLIYLITVLGNIGISVLICTDTHLRTPMYFLLCNLACIDLCYSTSVTPKMLDNFLLTRNVISFTGCAVQQFCFSVFVTSECLLLGVMAYDRYVAICNPLLYPVIINQRTCGNLLCATYVVSTINASAQASLTFSLSFCRSNIIDHFFCDFPPLLKLSCSDTSTNEVVIFVLATCLGMGSCGIIISSYCHIISTILMIPSVKGRYKTFSTCASHFTVVTLFFGTIFIMYLHPASSSSMTQNKIVSLFYTVVIPMLNPMIYSLRNQEVKRAFQKLIRTMIK